MPKKYLQLEDTRVYYDQKLGSIRLISKDNRLRGKSFQLNLVRDSPASESIYELLEAEGIIDRTENDLPQSVLLPETVPGWAPRVSEDDTAVRNYGSVDLRFLLGETFGNKYLEIDLAKTPHTFIGGAPGMGKSGLIRSITEQVLKRPDIYLCSIDLLPYPQDSNTLYGKFRLQDGLATDMESGLKLLTIIQDELEARFELLECQGFNSWHEAESMQPLIVTVDGLMSSDHMEGMDGILEIMGKLARLGKIVGIFLIAATSSSDLKVLTGETKANFGRRILMGWSDPETQADVLGTAVGYGKGLLDRTGRGMIRTYSAPMKTFQAFDPR